jgi:hypothetical protein
MDLERLDRGPSHAMYQHSLGETRENHVQGRPRFEPCSSRIVSTGLECCDQVESRKAKLSRYTP